MRRGVTPLGVVTGVFLCLAALAIGGLIVVMTGGYNVAASEPHTPIGRWVTSTTMENSVKSRAARIVEPQFTQAMIVKGGGEYKAMCAGCHGGPGVQPAEWTTGMLPQPPNLIEHIGEWRPREVFWMLKHGIKMSGMPAFGGTHSDETIWTMAAFAKQLPTMTAAAYAAIPAEEEGEGHHHGDKSEAAGQESHQDHGEPGHHH